jgi:hypothetical protein
MGQARSAVRMARMGAPLQGKLQAGHSHQSSSVMRLPAALSWRRLGVSV